MTFDKYALPDYGMGSPRFTHEQIVDITGARALTERDNAFTTVAQAAGEAFKASGLADAARNPAFAQFRGADWAGITGAAAFGSFTPPASPPIVYPTIESDAYVYELEARVEAAEAKNRALEAKCDALERRAWHLKRRLDIPAYRNMTDYPRPETPENESPFWTND